jgi:hypothetical protein
MRYLRMFNGCTKLDRIENEDIRKEMKTQSVLNKIN